MIKVNEKINSFSLSVPVEDAIESFQELIRKTRSSNEVFLDALILPNPAGNKLWEIEVKILHVTSRLRDKVVAKPVCGYFACHRRGTFTTYSVVISGKERWFDNFDLAFASLIRKKTKRKTYAPPPGGATI